MIPTFFLSPFEQLHHWLLVAPLSNLYYFGPTFHGYGFWNGTPIEDICASLTGSPSAFWINNLGECQQLVERQFFAFLAGAHFILYAFIMYRFFTHLWTYIFVTRPIIKSMRQFLQRREEEEDANNNRNIKAALPACAPSRHSNRARSV